jgi:hypothetical protein
MVCHLKQPAAFDLTATTAADQPLDSRTSPTPWVMLALREEFDYRVAFEVNAYRYDHAAEVRREILA